MLGMGGSNFWEQMRFYQKDFHDIVKMCFESGEWSEREWGRKRIIPLAHYIGITIYWLAHGCTFRVLQSHFGYFLFAPFSHTPSISKSCIDDIIPRVLSAIIRGVSAKLRSNHKLLSEPAVLSNLTPTLISVCR